MKAKFKTYIFLILGVLIGIGITYIVLNLAARDRWYIGWECLFWNTTQGAMISGQGQYISADNQTVFATWEQLGYLKTECVKYVYVKQKWKMENAN